MMMNDLLSLIQKKTNDLDYSLKQLRENGIAFAQAEKDYKMSLARNCLELRDSGMAIGLLEKVCYGLEEVSDLRFSRDCAKTVYQANLEAINTIKLELRLLDAQLKREWDNA